MRTAAAITLYLVFSMLCVVWTFHGPFSYVGALSMEATSTAECVAFIVPALTFKALAGLFFFMIRS